VNARHCTLLLGLAALLAGCGSHGVFRDRGFDYLRAEAVAPLAYPEGLQAIPAKELYPVPGIDTRRRLADGEKPELVVPAPPQLLELATISESSVPVPSPAAGGKVLPEQVVLTADGNGYPVLMMTLGFDWAWQILGDVLAAQEGVEVVDLDREQAAYFVVVNGKRSGSGEPYQLKLNYTANGIQLALQVNDDAMAPRELAAALMGRLRDGLLK
jgi:uncharacterized lipoprotein